MTLEIGSVSPTSALERIAAALEAAHAVEAAADPAAADAADAVHGVAVAKDSAAAADASIPRHPQAAETLARGGFAERVLGEASTTIASAPAPVPGERADRNVETTTLQTHTRPTTVLPERPQTATHVDASIPSGGQSKTEFALPSALLVPATLVGLQIEPAAGWPLTRRGLDTQPAAPAPVKADPDRAVPPAAEEEPEDESAGDGADSAPEDTHASSACPHVFENAGDDDWCEALTVVLREALASKVPPRALLVAAEQWQRGRCVVLACPQAFDAAGPAWAFVLWPRRAARPAAGRPAPLTLSGIRVDARLQWSAPPRGPKWLHVRVIKEHHPQRGRQLIPNVPGANGAVECEVQLGPVLARALRRCDVCVRIQAAQRFWAALGTQWSMLVAVSSLPLLPQAGDVDPAADPARTRDSRC